MIGTAADQTAIAPGSLVKEWTRDGRRYFHYRAEKPILNFYSFQSARYATRGYSANSFQLRMSREDIGNYLGLTIESISRLLSRFKKQGWIAVDKRDVTLLDPAKLKALASGADVCSPMA